MGWRRRAVVGASPAQRTAAFGSPQGGGSGGGGGGVWGLGRTPQRSPMRNGQGRGREKRGVWGELVGGGVYCRALRPPHAPRIKGHEGASPLGDDMAHICGEGMAVGLPTRVPRALRGVTENTASEARGAANSKRSGRGYPSNATPSPG